MFTRKSNDTTRSASTATAGIAPPASSTQSTPRRKGGFLRRLHPDHTNQALETKINSPRTTEREAHQAQDELRERGITPPKRSMGTKMTRLREKWHSSGRATSKTAPPTH